MPYMLELERSRPTYVNIRSTDDSLTVQKLVDRSTNTRISWNDLISADYLLYLRDAIHHSGNYNTWISFFLNSKAGRYDARNSVVPVFRLSESQTYFHKLRHVLGVTSKEDLIERLTSALGFRNETQSCMELTRLGATRT